MEEIIKAAEALAYDAGSGTEVIVTVPDTFSEWPESANRHERVPCKFGVAMTSNTPLTSPAVF